MPNTIPPLVCNTPPPIDDLDSDEDLSAPNDNFDQFDDESLPSSPQLKQTTTILPNDNFAAPETDDSKRVAESPLSLELDLESQHVNEDLDNFSVAQDDDEELRFESDKLRNENDSAIGDVYSNGNSSTITVSKKSEASPSATEHNETQSNLEKCDADTQLGEEEKHEYSGDNVLSVDQQDNLSSSPSWNLDSIRQTPEPEFGSLSMQGELNSIESSYQVATDSKETADVQHIEQSLPDDTVPLDDVEQTLSQTANDFNDSGFRNDNLVDESKSDEFCTNFEADFGQFATFDDVNATSETFNAAEAEPMTLESTEQCDKSDAFAATFDNNNDDDDDDDEFGEFSDFQQTTAVHPETVTQPDATVNDHVLLDSENIKQNLSSVLTNIFPTDDRCDAESSGQYDGRTHEKEHFVNEITTQLKNVENSKALAHQWSKSTTKTVLVKALGIDSRNILYGEKWNSSAPKFAANLGLSPLEPMKVTSSTSNDSDGKPTKSVFDVPAAQFDWNSSGLINPLDGAPKSTLEQNILIESKTIDRGKSNQTHSAAHVSDAIPTPEQMAPVPATDAMSISKIDANIDQCETDLEPAQTSDSYTVPGSSMKETHIFTPIKPIVGESPLMPNGASTRSDVPLADSDQILSDSIVIKENVVKKEYRDVEYDPSKVLASADDFTEFQFVQPTPNNATIETCASLSHSKSQPNSINFQADSSTDKLNSNVISNDKHFNSFDNLKSISTLESQLSGGIFQSKPSNVNAINNGNRPELNLYSINDNFHSHKNVSIAAIDPMEIFSISSSDQKHSVHSKQGANADILPNSFDLLQPTNAATTMTNSIDSSTFLSSSSILMPQSASAQSSLSTNAPSIQWPEPGINFDQLEQLEKRFQTQPTEVTPKIDQKDNADTNADDEWSDFVSVVQPQTPITNILNKNLLKQQQQSNDEDDWSEFVSSTPPPLTRLPTNAVANDANSNSNYESVFKTWNNTFQSSSSQPLSNNFIVEPSPLRPTIYSASNFDGIAYQMAPQPIAPSIISLPDLRFVAPKSLINMPNRPKAKK